jgi:hypothetical protein
MLGVERVVLLCFTQVGRPYYWILMSIRLRAQACIIVDIKVKEYLTQSKGESFMKIYTYKEEQIGMYPKFQERPWEPKGEGVEEVDSPEEADFIICPVALHRIKSKDPTRRIFEQAVPVERLPYWKNFESKHVFFDCSDFEVDLNGTSAMLIRCNLRDWMKKDGQCVSWFWPVDDLEECVEVPSDGFKYDISFHGWLSTDTRKKSVESCKSVLGDKIDHKTFSNFFGHLPEDSPECIERRENFLNSIRQSKMLLCPQSIQGVFPYRFYEALSAGRIPLLLCTGFNLPFQSEIDWDKCIITAPAEQASNAGNIIKNFLETTSEEKQIEMMKYGRYIWKTWLNRDKQSELVAYTLRKKLGEI